MEYLGCLQYRLYGKTSCSGEQVYPLFTLPINGAFLKVTGASGFLAAHIISLLLAEGYAVRGSVYNYLLYIRKAYILQDCTPRQDRIPPGCNYRRQPGLLASADR